MVVVPNFSPIRPSFDATCWPSIGCLGARRSSRKTSGTCDKPLRDGALRNQGQLGVPIKKPGHPKIGQLLASGMENGPNMCGLYIYHLPTKMVIFHFAKCEKKPEGFLGK